MLFSLAITYITNTKLGHTHTHSHTQYMVQSHHLERIQCSWSPASWKKTLDLFCCDIQGGKSIEIVSCSNCTTHWTPPRVSLVRQPVRHVCMCMRVSQAGEWCDMSERTVYGLVAGVHLWNKPVDVMERQVTLSQHKITFWCVRPQHSSLIPTQSR